MDAGINIYGDVLLVVMKDFYIQNNTLLEFATGIDCSSGNNPEITNLYIENNVIEANYDSSAGQGINVHVEEAYQVSINNNTIRDYGTNGIRITKDGSSGNSVAYIIGNKVYSGLATFTGQGIRDNGDTLVEGNNIVIQSGGVDYDLTTTEVIGNADLNIKMKTGTLSTPSGASVTFTDLFPIGAMPLGVSTRVTTLITGATSIDLGDGSDVDRWTSAGTVTLGSTTGPEDFTIKTLVWGTSSAQSVVVTANGANFTGGAIKIIGYYLDITPIKG